MHSIVIYAYNIVSLSFALMSMSELFNLNKKRFFQLQMCFKITAKTFVLVLIVI